MITVTEYLPTWKVMRIVLHLLSEMWNSRQACCALHPIPCGTRLFYRMSVTLSRIGNKEPSPCLSFNAPHEYNERPERIQASLQFGRVAAHHQPGETENSSGPSRTLSGASFS
jgi:hypothetical protein